MPQPPTKQEWKNYPKNKIPLPTVGRVVYYYSEGAEEPLAAIVAAVLKSEGDPAREGGYTVNLGVFNWDGSSGGQRNVPHRDDAGDRQNMYRYWDWMPFQKGQAAKTEELQRELDAKSGPGSSGGSAAGGQGAAGAMPGSK